jgi:hypothetical protein
MSESDRMGLLARLMADAMRALARHDMDTFRACLSAANLASGG